ncbi:hypothetical protein B0H11DRAFT_1923293 [Mycena galericulata]|nr:hypothetical protein B0H11DRAFT_1923293 [Mycena galericulata]
MWSQWPLNVIDVEVWVVSRESSALPRRAWWFPVPRAQRGQCMGSSAGDPDARSRGDPLPDCHRGFGHVGPGGVDGWIARSFSCGGLDWHWASLGSRFSEGFVVWYYAASSKRGLLCVYGGAGQARVARGRQVTRRSLRALSSSGPRIRDSFWRRSTAAAAAYATPDADSRRRCAFAHWIGLSVQRGRYAQDLMITGGPRYLCVDILLFAESSVRLRTGNTAASGLVNDAAIVQARGDAFERRLRAGETAASALETSSSCETAASAFETSLNGTFMYSECSGCPRDEFKWRLRAGRRARAAASRGLNCSECPRDELKQRNRCEFLMARLDSKRSTSRSSGVAQSRDIVEAGHAAPKWYRKGFKGSTRWNKEWVPDLVLIFFSRDSPGTAGPNTHAVPLVISVEREVTTKHFTESAGALSPTSPAASTPQKPHTGSARRGASSTPRAAAPSPCAASKWSAAGCGSGACLRDAEGARRGGQVRTGRAGAGGAGAAGGTVDECGAHSDGGGVEAAYDARDAAGDARGRGGRTGVGTEAYANTAANVAVYASAGYRNTSADEYDLLDEDYDKDDELSEDEDEIAAALESSVKELALGDWARGRILDDAWVAPAADIPPKTRSRQRIPYPGLSPHPIAPGTRDIHRDPHPLPADASPTTPQRLRPSLAEAAHAAHMRQMHVVFLPAFRNVVRRVVVECARGRQRRTPQCAPRACRSRTWCSLLAVGGGGRGTWRGGAQDDAGRDAAAVRYSGAGGGGDINDEYSDTDDFEERKVLGAEMQIKMSTFSVEIVDKIYRELSSFVPVFLATHGIFCCRNLGVGQLSELNCKGGRVVELDDALRTIAGPSTVPGGEIQDTYTRNWWKLTFT